MNILFVCSGNTCRSPLAMAVLNSAEIKGVVADSAGLSVAYNYYENYGKENNDNNYNSNNYNSNSNSVNGSDNTILVNEKSVNALEYLNINRKYIIHYKPKPLTVELCKKADIIAVMENSHKLFIESFFKSENFNGLNTLSKEEKEEIKNKKIIVLNIPDPFGQSQEVYNKTALALKEKINELINIKKISAKSVNSVKAKNSTENPKNDCNLNGNGITEKEAEELEIIEKECFKKPWSRQSFKDSVNTEFYIYYLNRSAIGYVGVLKVLNERYITNIGVLKKYRNKKVAVSLLDAAIKNAESENAAFISLEVRKSNTAAINLYKKFNFKLSGERKNFYTSPLEDAYIFTLNF